MTQPSHSVGHQGPDPVRRPGETNALRSALNDDLRRVVRDLSRTQQLIVLGVLVGTASGLSAFVLAHAVDLARAATLRGLPRKGLFHVVGMIAFPSLGALLGAALIARFSPEARGHGVNEVLAAMRSREGRIPGAVAWVKLVASSLTIGLGGSAGREGPIIQIGGAVGSSLGRRLRVPAEDMKMLVAAGATAGLAASFGAPLSAVFFAMEVLVRDFASDVYPAIVIASVTGAATARLLLGDMGYVMPLDYKFNGAPDLLVCVWLGLACALIGRLYRRAIDALSRRTEALPPHLALLAPAAGGATVGLIALVFPEVVGSGQGPINDVVAAPPGAARAAAMSLAKVAATTATLGSGGSGGALMPAMYVGALAGLAARGPVAAAASLAMDPGSAALTGMAATIAAAFRAPVTAILLAFEVSRDYDVLLPVMLACAIAYLAAGGHDRRPPVIEH